MNKIKSFEKLRWLHDINFVMASLNLGKETGKHRIRADIQQYIHQEKSVPDLIYIINCVLPIISTISIFRSGSKIILYTQEKTQIYP
jgi:hypothetical protein